MENTQSKQLIEVSQEEFEAMRAAIDQSISRDNIGLDDMMIKKMLLAYNTGKYSHNTDIIIELTDEEGIACKNNSNISKPFTLIQGKNLEQLNMNIFDNIGSHLNQFFETNSEKEAVIEAERIEKQGKQEKYYLYTKGILKFIGDVQQADGTTKEEELVYYDEKAMDKLFEEYEDKKDWENRDYAESIWNYLSSKAYTDGDKGIKMYSHEVINEKVVDWTFEDSEAIKLTPQIHRQVFNPNSPSYFRKVRSLQDIEYYSIVSKYATPVEFMIDLLNISSSKEFVNAFIDKVTNQTSITLKIYKTRLASGTEITQDIEETTTVEGEVQITARVKQFEKDADGDIALEDGNAGITVDVDLESGSAIGIGYTKVKLTLRNVPSKIRRVIIEVKIAERANPELPVDIISIGKDIPNGKTEEVIYLLDRYKTKSNTGTINRVDTMLNTETKLDIAIEEAVTWYGTMTYNNYVQDSPVWESIDSTGKRVSVASAEPIMVSKTKTEEVWTPTKTGWSEIINTSKSVDSIIATEVASRVENWYANLTSDNLLYWKLGGPLTHNLYEWLDGDRGRSFGTENELLNLRFIYAMEEGIGDAFTKNTYTPIEVTYKANSYKIGYLYTNINNELVHDTTPTVKSNYDFFLSLLKNNTGTYSRNAVYNPNGKEVVYETVYGSKDRVGRFFESSAEMLFDLLNTSPYTEGLNSVMRYILYVYSTKNYGVTEFTYNIIPKNEFEWI